MAGTALVRSYGRARRASLALIMTGLLVGLCAAPATAGPDVGTKESYPVEASAFTAAPAVGAPIGEAVVLWGNGAATATVDLPGPVVRFHFVAEAELCQGPPRLEARIDGRAVSGRCPGGLSPGRASTRWPAIGPRAVTP